ncbi:MAG: DUF1501 domain-containing protein [Acidimicrobiia bacterium]
MDRRGFLKLTGAGAGGLLIGFATERGRGGKSETRAATVTDADSDSAAATTPGKVEAAGETKNGKVTKAAPVKQRRLVVIELDGGNDGLSTLVPYGLGRYNDLRPRTKIDAKQLAAIDKTYAVPKTLKGAWDSGLAFVMGVGTAQPDGSHFAMMNRWWAGDVTGKATTATGFLGRLADRIGDPNAEGVGIVIGSSMSPALAADKVSTLALPGTDSARYLVRGDDNDMAKLFQSGFVSMMQGDAEPLGLARASGRSAVAFAEKLEKLGDGADGYPGSQLGQSLALAARMMSANENLKIALVTTGGYDTHTNHRDNHANLMQDLNDSLVAFNNDLDARGLRDAVAIATTSEFGRKAHDNASNGLDHGAASVAMLLGPVHGGLYGEYSSLDKLDDDDNLVATIGFDSYYATIAEKWFEVPASDVLGGNPKPIDKLFL